MPKILEYNSLTVSAGDDLLFIGDYSNTNSNPTINNITTDNLFKRATIRAASSSGLSIYDDSSNLSIFVSSADNGNVGIGGTSAAYTLQVNGDLNVTGKIFDSSGDAGTAGQVLSSTGTGTDWIDAASGGGVTGSGTQYHIPIWSTTSQLGNSIITQVNSKVGVDSAPGTAKCGKLEIAESGIATALAITNTWTSSATPLVLFSDRQSNPYEFYFSKNSLLFSMGSNATPNNANVNISVSNGYFGIGTTTIGKPLTVTRNTDGMVGCFYSTRTGYAGSAYIGSDSGLSDAFLTVCRPEDAPIASFESNNSNGSVMYLKNTNSSGGGSVYKNIISYSNYESSQQDVNWLTGTVKLDDYDGTANVKSFAIHHSTANLGTGTTNFDCTNTNNLFYINTLGNQHLARSIHTHNKTNTGHNTGRFICVHSVPFNLDHNFDGSFGSESNFLYFPAIQRTSLCVGNFTGSSGTTEVMGYFNCIGWTCVAADANNSTNRDSIATFGRNIYAAKLIKITSYLNSEIVAGSATAHDFKVRFYCAAANAASFTWSTSIHVAEHTINDGDYNMANSDCAVRSTACSSNVSVDIPINSYLAAGMVGSSGPMYGSIDFTYEFKIT